MHSAAGRCPAAGLPVSDSPAPSRGRSGGEHHAVAGAAGVHRLESLGGLAERAGVEALEGDAEEGIEAGDGTLGSLRDRTDDWTEDMEERETIEQIPEEPDVTESEAEAEQKEAE